MKEIIKINLGEDLSKNIEILNNKIRAIRALFFSYMNNEYEIFNDIKFGEVFDEYTRLTMAYNEMIWNTMRNNLSDEILDFIEVNHCNIRFSYLTKAIYIACTTDMLAQSNA